MSLSLALLLLQSPVLQVSAEVDRARVAVGEEVVYTLKAVGHSTAPFRVDLSSLAGFALVERRERTDVVVGTRETTRAYTLELQLRAEQVGAWDIGPIRVEHADGSAFSPVVAVAVVNASGAGAPGLEPDLLAMIPRVPSPRTGGPSVFVVTSDALVYAGDQVNVLTAAWLPRGLRLRLRQPPSLSPPSLPGVWSTPRAAVAGAVASRVVDGETYDLFVGFQTVYPLNPGTVPIPAARLTWMQPSGRQYFSDERRLSAESDPMVLVIRPPASAGRPAGFDGPVARDLGIEYRLGTGSARAGAVFPVEIRVSGAGNLPLWPAPRVDWPPATRVYEEGTEGSPRMNGLRLGGTKTFRYVVVPDSAGSLALPPLEYPYFSPSDGSYRVVRAPGILVPVLDAMPTADRRNPVPLLEPGPVSLPDRVMQLPPLPLVLLILGPVALLGLGTWRSLRHRPRGPAPAVRDPVERLDALLAGLLPPGCASSAPALAAALREAGLPRGSAERLVELHDAVERERFSPAGTGEASPALVREIATALEGMPRGLHGARISAVVALLWLAALALGTGPAWAQTPGDLYDRGEFGAAAQAFRAVADTFGNRQPLRWYNVAAAEYLARRDAHAAAALLAVRGRAPRDRHATALWNGLAREHDQLRRAAPQWPLTAEECLVSAMLLAWMGALAFVARRQWRVVWGGILVLAIVAGAAGLVLRAERQTPRAVLVGGASLRLSPHGLSPERGSVPGFSVVQLERQLGGWWLIRSADGNQGWVPGEILAISPALD